MRHTIQDARLKTRGVMRACLAMLCLGSWIVGRGSVFAGQLPSLFRGVVVANASPGIRVVSVEENSQAGLADLRPEDVLIGINGARVQTIDEFAVLSQELKGKAVAATLSVLRNGQPREILLHLYSVPILRTWDLVFVPEHDIRFADRNAGLLYWMQLGHGFETAQNPERALNAYLNALHNDPAQPDIALKVSELLCQIARTRLEDHRLRDALAPIQQATVLLQHLFDQPLNDAQLQIVRGQLQDVVHALRKQASKGS